MHDDLKYRGFRISEVCGSPFAVMGNPESPSATLDPKPPYSGVEGLVRAIDTYWFLDSAKQVQAALEARRAQLVAGTWDVVKCQPKEETNNA